MVNTWGFSLKFFPCFYMLEKNCNNIEGRGNGGGEQMVKDSNPKEKKAEIRPYFVPVLMLDTHIADRLED